jgi:hypothetical protein
MTCRPGLIPIDLKRQGRAEEHLALFYPESEADRKALFNALVRKLDLDIRKFPTSDMFKKYRMDDRVFVTREDMEEAMGDFVPAAYPHEVDLQNLVAILEYTSKEMIPKKFRDYTRTRMIKEIQELKTLLGKVS